MQFQSGSGSFPVMETQGTTWARSLLSFNDTSLVLLKHFLPCSPSLDGKNNPEFVFAVISPCRSLCPEHDSHHGSAVCLVSL